MPTRHDQHVGHFLDLPCPALPCPALPAGANPDAEPAVKPEVFVVVVPRPAPGPADAPGCPATASARGGAAAAAAAAGADFARQPLARPSTSMSRGALRRAMANAVTGGPIVSPRVAHVYVWCARPRTCVLECLVC